MSAESTAVRAAPRAGPESVSAPAIRAFIRDALVAVQIPADDAARIAELMTEADLTGADAHGVFRLPQYVKRVEAGGFNRRPNVTVNRTAAATALVDGDNAFGHLVMSRAAETAIAMARESGIGWAGVRRSNHAGPAGLYAEMPVPHGMIGLYSAVASANHMAVWGGAETLLGTNPLAIGLPTGDGPMVFDMATTVVSYGTVKNYALQGRTMPEGWFVDRHDGTPLTDPRRSADGLLLPIGGYKGSGLALVLGLLAGTLNGASFGRDVVDFNADEKSFGDTGHFIIALDIARFTPLASFTAEVDRHLRDLRGSARLPGFDAIRLPGEERRHRRADRVGNGVPMAGELVVQLDRLAAELELVPLRER
jgi:LDH2 family malate/lactate/ureidoglycolate dehydrogenase